MVTVTNPVEPAGSGFFRVHVRVPLELFTDATNPPAAELLTNAGPAGRGSVIVAPVQLSNVDAQRNRIVYVKFAPGAGAVLDTRLSMTRLGAAEAAGTSTATIVPSMMPITPARVATRLTAVIGPRKTPVATAPLTVMSAPQNRQ